MEQVISATTLIGDAVVNTEGKDIGKIEEVMLDVPSGRISYAVLSFGGFMGMGNKLFALPWQVLRVDFENHRVVINVEKDLLKKAEGFDKDAWPDFADAKLRTRIERYYQVKTHA